MAGPVRRSESLGHCCHGLIMQPFSLRGRVVRRKLAGACLGALIGLLASPSHAQNRPPNPLTQGVILWISTVNGTLMGMVGGAAVAAMSNDPHGNCNEYMRAGAGLGTLAGMATGVISITGLPNSGTGGPAPGGAPAPQPGAAFGYTPERGLQFQTPTVALYRAGPRREAMGVGLVLLSGRF
jgi:hypothetical protein